DLVEEPERLLRCAARDDHGAREGGKRRVLRKTPRRPGDAEARERFAELVDACRRLPEVAHVLGTVRAYREAVQGERAEPPAAPGPHASHKADRLQGVDQRFERGVADFILAHEHFDREAKRWAEGGALNAAHLLAAALNEAVSEVIDALRMGCGAPGAKVPDQVFPAAKPRSAVFHHYAHK